MWQKFQDFLDVERHSLAPDSVRGGSIALVRIITKGLGLTSRAGYAPR
jgi:hypothetical protein